MTLDRNVKIGPIVLPRWIIGADAYDATGTDARVLIHQSEPRFICRWCVGEPATLSAFVFKDAAVAALDAWIAWNGADAWPD